MASTCRQSEAAARSAAAVGAAAAASAAAIAPAASAAVHVQGDATLQFQAQQGALTLEQEINQIGATHNFTKLVSM
jgi:hypothetical protein